MKILRTIPEMPPSWLFETREQAGEKLARELIASYLGADGAVMAIPRGGVPVGVPIALALDAPLDVIILRKIPIPWDPEAGFGAVTAEGTVILNEDLLPFLGMTREEIERAAREVQRELERRTKAYRGEALPPKLEGKVVIVTDDGLATGFTMVAAVRSLRRHNPARVVVAVPVAPRDSLERVNAEADDVVCLIEQLHPPFAVASFYHYFPELDDRMVRDLLREFHVVE